MRAPEMAAPPGCWIDDVVARRIALWTAIYLGLIWVLASGLNRPVVEPIRNGWVLDGHGLASYPMWGYSLLIRLLGSVHRVVVLQSALGALATAMLMVRLNSLAPRARPVTTALFVLSLPWLSYMSYAYQMPFSSAFVILALLGLDMAMRSGQLRWGLVAGTLVGLAQNFRSEILLLPGTILVVVCVLNRPRGSGCPSIKPLAACVGVALLLQLPWALNCHLNAGRFSLSESNLGEVAFLGLGQPPSNPWSIAASDGFAQETVTKAGLDCSSLSFQGDDFLRREFVAAVRRHPGAYVKCIGVRIWATVSRPFEYVHPAATPAEERAVRELTGMKPWIVRSVAAEPETPGRPPSRLRVACIMLYLTVQAALIHGVSILGIVGLALALGKAPFRLNQPIVLCLGVALAYRAVMNVAVSVSGKYMTGVYLCYLPFVANALWAMSQWWRQQRSGAVGTAEGRPRRPAQPG